MATCNFFWEEKLVVPLIVTPNVDKAIEDKCVGLRAIEIAYKA
jgi:hypothetical protein